MTGMVVLEATRGVRDHQPNYWHAQFWATARLNQVTSVFSEGLDAGAVVEVVRSVNPFAREFDLADWVT